MKTFPCRFCSSPVSETVVDLGDSPVANALIPADKSDTSESFYPLQVFVCASCFLVQLPDTVSSRNIFNDQYTYFSSYSDSWLNHAKSYTDMITKRFPIGTDSLVVELASNDGYLLQYFVEKDIPVLGIDPSANVAEEAHKKGIPTRIVFFGKQEAKRLIKEGKSADLIIANNVLAHVPDINDFVSGINILLKKDGIVTAEFPHLVNLIQNNQFDTIYHEHYSYFSFIVIEKVFAHNGMRIFDVEEIPTHGGSLRIYGTPAKNDIPISQAVHELRSRETMLGYSSLYIYRSFGERVQKTIKDTVSFLTKAKQEGKSIIGYGAAAKGNTFLNSCGIGGELIDYVVDRSPHKQGTLLPGTHIPVYSPDKIRETRPDYIIILPWNLKKEIAAQLSYTKKWGAKCIVAIPEVTVLG